MNSVLLAILAHVSAQRRLLINAYACGFIDEADPIAAARHLQDNFARSPTLAPPDGNGLDPATSDMVAAMTDESISDFMDRVVAKLEQMVAPVPRAQPADFVQELLGDRRP